VLPDDLAAQAVLAPGLPVVGPRRLRGSQAGQEATRDRPDDGGEGELGREDQGYEERRGGYDIGAGAAEVGDEHPGQELAHRAAGPHGLLLVNHGAEAQGEEAGEGEKEQGNPHRLGVGGLDRPAPEQLPAEQAHHEREQERRHPEELSDQELGQEGTEGSDEVSGGPLRAGLEEGSGVPGVERGERDEQHQGEGESDEPQELRPALRSRECRGHQPFFKPPSPPE
jgi:hypothetical protein